MRIAIVHPWLPQYRMTFFSYLQRIAAEAGVSIDIYHGQVPREWASRGDACRAPFAIELRTRFLAVGRRSLIYRDTKPIRYSKYDYIVLEQAVRNIETYLLCLGKHRKKIAFWGHGRHYVKPVSRIQRRALQILTRRGKWFFAYTPGGRDAVAQFGFDKNRVTVINNSIDSAKLASAVSSMSLTAVDAFIKDHDLSPNTVVYVGGLDSSKRLEFLFNVSARVADVICDFRLVVIGSGPLRVFVEERAAEQAEIRYLGSEFGTVKAAAYRAARAIVMPGRVGLIAVDSFASGCPLVTTQWPWHAPEFEYLEDGINSIITLDSEAHFARGIISVLQSEELQSSLAAGARSSAAEYTVENMARNFLGGVLELASSKVIP